jgi:hypothetical protein
MMVGVGEANEQIPPIEHQRDAARHQAAALEVARREAAPSPLVLQLVEIIFAIGAIALELANSENLAAQRRDQNGVFPNLPAIVDLGKAKPQLALSIMIGEGQ